MNTTVSKILTLVSAIVVFSASAAHAIPTFQTYITGGTAGDYYKDQDTWFSGSNPLTLNLVGAYSSQTTALQGVTLIISVPNGETGTVTIIPTSSSLAVPNLLTTKGQYPPPNDNPNKTADKVVLSNIAGNNGYEATDFLPAGANFNNHYPLQAGVSDFILFGIGSFGKLQNVSNYDADTGTITSSEKALGEIKSYTVSYTGFSSLHFDIYGVEYEGLNKKIKTSWEINPGSHDSTAFNAVPEPSSLLLLAGGAGCLLYGLRRRKQ